MTRGDPGNQASSTRYLHRQGELRSDFPPDCRRVTLLWVVRRPAAKWPVIATRGECGEESSSLVVTWVLDSKAGKGTRQNDSLRRDPNAS